MHCNLIFRNKYWGFADRLIFSAVMGIFVVSKIKILWGRHDHWHYVFKYLKLGFLNAKNLGLRKDYQLQTCLICFLFMIYYELFILSKIPYKDIRAWLLTKWPTKYDCNILWSHLQLSNCILIQFQWFQLLSLFWIMNNAMRTLLNIMKYP